MRREGCSEEVLLAQIEKYKEVLLWPDDEIISYANTALAFGNADNCPVCLYRFYGGIRCHIKGVMPCLAINNNIKCYDQKWFKDIQEGTIETIDEVKKALRYRLKYWKAVHAGKHPVKS